MASTLERNGASAVDPDIQRGMQMLERIIGGSSDQVSVDWKSTADSSGKSEVVVTLSDYAGRVQGTLSRRELRDDYHLEGRLLRLWSELLGQRVNHHLNRVRELVVSVGEVE